MNGIIDRAIAHPRRTIVLAFVLTMCVAPGMLRLRLRTDGHALVPETAPQVIFDGEIRQRFGLDDPLVVLIRTDHPDGVFNHDTLKLVERLTESLASLDGIRPWTVFSLATEHSDRVWSGTLKFRRFLEPFPETRDDRLRLRDDLRAIKLYSGTLVSRDEQATAVMVGVPPRANRTAFYERIRVIVDQLGPSPDAINIIGAPVAEALLGTHIMEDLGVPHEFLGHPTFTETQETPAGFPASFHELRVWIARNIGLLPIAIGIMAPTFFLCFRSVIAVALPMGEVLAAMLFVFGVMGWSGVPVYLTIAVLPIILVVTGVTDEIHLFMRYRNLLARRNADSDQPGSRARVDHVVILRETVGELRPAIIKTSLTTAVGCLSFAMSPLAAVRAFGIFSALGVLFCMCWSLIVIPAMLSLIDPRRITPRVSSNAASKTAESRSATIPRFASLVIRLRWPIVLAALGLLALGPYGVRRIRVQDSWIDGFAPESAFRQTTEYFNEQFLGTHLLHVVVQAELDAPVIGTVPAQQMRSQSITLPADLGLTPAALVGKWIRITRKDDPLGAGSQSDDAAQREVPIRQVGRVWSAPIEQATPAAGGIIITCGRRHGSARAALRLYGSDEARFEIFSRPMMSPLVLRAIERFEGFLAARVQDAVGGVLGPGTYIKTTNFMAKARSEAERAIPNEADRIEWLWEQYQRIRGIEHRRQIVSDDYATSIVSIYLNDANFIDTARLLSATRDYAERELEPMGLNIAFAGDVAVSQTLIDAIVTTQVRSLLGALIGIVLITSILGRSLLWGLLSALPCSLAVLTNFAFMGYVEMPLGVATSMFTGMTLGMGIDYAVHFIERYRRIRRGGSGAYESIQGALSVAGPAILVDAVAVALGFGVLILSQVPANARLGSLVILSLTVCLMSSLVLLPAIIAIAGGKRSGKMGRGEAVGVTQTAAAEALHAARPE